MKADSVVLEDKSRLFNSVIIDFGKSTKIDTPTKKKSMTKAEQKPSSNPFLTSHQTLLTEPGHKLLPAMCTH